MGPSGRVWVALGVALALLSAGCSSSGVVPAPQGSGDRDRPIGSRATDTGDRSAPATPAAGLVGLTIVPAAGAASVPPARPVTVRARNGTLSAVHVLNPEGAAVEGRFSADRSTWTSTEPLGYGRRYTVTASAAGAAAGAARVESSFTTVTPAAQAFPSFFPPPSMKTVGVGQPIAVIFSTAPPDKAAAERALRVTTSPAVEGSWYWFDDRTVHWRPREYWKPGTRVTVRAEVYGVDLGGGVYGETDRELKLTIGRSKIAVIDDRTKRMVAYVDGRKVLTAPVSMGRPGSVTVNGKKISFLTQSGIHVAQEKYPVKQMSSATYGLPTDADLGYDSRIPLAVRISNSGEFVHSAPWSVRDQGRRNVSHGCVNLPPKAAEWFYRTFSYGDVVDIRNTGATLRADDGFGDWNIPWKQWLAGSALR